ncbi:MAG: hypothetical protein AAF619_00860 [Pseudomonadota bacterium]
MANKAERDEEDQEGMRIDPLAALARLVAGDVLPDYANSSPNFAEDMRLFQALDAISASLEANILRWENELDEIESVQLPQTNVRKVFEVAE